MLVVSSCVLALLASLIHVRPVFDWVFLRRWKFVLLGIATLSAPVVAEMSCRVFDPLGISYFSKMEKHIMQMTEYDPDLKYVLLPNVRVDYGTFRVDINSDGMRDRELRVKDDDEYRILVLGDSVAFGWGVNVDEGVCRVLERELTYSTGQRVRTVNTSISGYNTTQQQKLLERVGWKTAPDAVLLIYVDNDVKQSLFDVRSERNVLGHSVSHALKESLGRSWLYRLANFTLSYSGSNATRSDVDRSALGWQDSMDSLRSIARSCRKREVPLLLCLYRMNHDAVTDALFEDISQIAQDEQFDLVDAAAWFDDVNRREVQVSVVDSHPNIRGHAILAAGISARVRRLLTNRR